MSGYIIKHVLPDGSVAGYHADSACSITNSPHHAKYSGRDLDSAKNWLAIVRRNFEFIWNLETSEFGGGPDYRAFEIWKGHSLDQISTVLEEVPTRERQHPRIVMI